MARDTKVALEERAKAIHFWNFAGEFAWESKHTNREYYRGLAAVLKSPAAQGGGE